MTSEEEALRAVLDKVAVLSSETVPLLDSLGRFPRRDVFATRPLPAFDNSAMDGYAVQAKSCKAGATLRIIGEQPAGTERGLTIGRGEAVRIFTGAPLPGGADAVVMQEDVVRKEDVIVPQCDVEPGESIRRRGTDLAEGQKILTRGEPVTPQAVALLATQGLAEIEVSRRPRVAIVSTGDELAQPGTALRAGQIYESNSTMLQAVGLRLGATIELAEYCPDELERLTEVLRRGLKSDAVIVSGGVSVGEHDLVRPALKSLGVEIDFWRVAIKPGKPFLFGRAKQCCIFGLPGNPVSAFITFLKFVRPALLKMGGASNESLVLREVTARLANDVDNPGDRPHYLRGRLEGAVFTATGRQESHALFGLSRANAILRVAPRAHFAAGESVSVELLD